jgi:hypothetical protein
LRGIQPGVGLIQSLEGTWPSYETRGESGDYSLYADHRKKHETVKFVDGTEKTEERPMQIFGFKNNSFVLAQADRQAFQPPVVPEWERDPPSITLDQIRRFPIFLTCYVIPTRPR